MKKSSELTLSSLIRKIILVGLAEIIGGMVEKWEILDPGFVRVLKHSIFPELLLLILIGLSVLWDHRHHKKQEGIIEQQQDEIEKTRAR